MHRYETKIILKDNLLGKNKELTMHCPFKHGRLRHILLSCTHPLGPKPFPVYPGRQAQKGKEPVQKKSESVNTGLLNSDPVTKFRLCCLDNKSSNSSVQISRGRQDRCKENTLESLFFYFYVKNKEGITCLQYFVYDDTDLNVMVLSCVQG